MADRSSTSGADPLPMSAARCSTPKRCCSSMTTRPSRWNATLSCMSACVPTDDARAALARAAALRRLLGGRGHAARAAAPARCRGAPAARRACGRAARRAARSAPSAPPGSRSPRASSMANSATTVLPVPTSPISSRCIRSGAVMSAVISPDGLLLVAGQLVTGSAALSAVVRSRRTSKRDAAPLPLGERPRADQHQLQVEQLVEGEPPAAHARPRRSSAAGGPARSASASGGSPSSAPDRLGKQRRATRGSSWSRCRSTRARISLWLRPSVAG